MNRKNSPFVGGRTRRGGRGRNAAALLLTIAVIAVASLTHYCRDARRSDADVSFHFIDVGQGDAALILTDEAAVVIDTGTVSSGDSLVSYIEKYTDKVDCLVISHPHEDHMGGAAELITSVEVDEVIMSAYSSDAAFFSRALDAMEERDVKVTEAALGETYTFGDIELTVLSPKRDYDDKNNNSVVMRAEVDGVSALFTGDAESSAEEDILDGYPSLLRCDILKVGHHGSTTSTTEKFLDAVSPEYAVISCGEGNSYGHPHRETLGKLESRGIEYYRTDEDSVNGAVVISVDGGKFSVR